MRTDTAPTPLLSLLRKLNSDQRAELAVAAGTSVGYLYQLAGCYPNRRACRSDLALRIAKGSVALRRKYRTPEVTMEQLATMCACGVQK
jgi:trehalose-6-phosphatase